MSFISESYPNPNPHPDPNPRLLVALEKAEITENISDEGHTEVTSNPMRCPKGGDEFMANPAWKKTAVRMTPVGLLGSSDPSAPESFLTLDWVHGYRLGLGLGLALELRLVTLTPTVTLP
jgi:hypothetical protein